MPDGFRKMMASINGLQESNYQHWQEKVHEIHKLEDKNDILM